MSEREEEVSRLKLRLMETIRPGSKCLVWLLPHCKSWYKNRDFFLGLLDLEKRPSTKLRIFSLVMQRVVWTLTNQENTRSSEREGKADLSD